MSWRPRYYGKTIKLGHVIDATLAPMADRVIAAASQLWNRAASLDVILVTGGGAELFGPMVKSHFPHALVVRDPVWANALGFWRFAQRLAE